MQNNKTPQYAVSHYMHTKVITASSDITLKEAVEIMLKNETNGLVVVDTEKRVVGILYIILQMVQDPAPVEHPRPGNNNFRVWCVFYCL